MRDGQPSLSAQRVVGYRLGANRLAAAYGHPAAEDALALDVADGPSAEPSELMARYLRARTAFFDRAVVNALDRGVNQIVIVGAGYDGRALRYAKPGVTWWEVDHPDTQADKRARLERLGIAVGHVRFVPRDLEAGGLAASLVESGFEAEAPSLFYCEGVAVYLSRSALATLLSALRSLATPGTRLAISLSLKPSPADAPDRRERLRAALAALGEPVKSSLSASDLGDLFTRSRWRPVEISERSQRAGLVVAAPAWARTPPGEPSSVGRIAGFVERMLHRSGGAQLGEHLESTYGVRVRSTRELDLGVHRVDLADGSKWIARVFPAVRAARAAHGDAEILGWLAASGFPAESCAASDPVSVHDGQSVLVTRLAPGRTLPAAPRSFQLLGRLLGRLHSMPDGCPAARRPAGGWHHLVFDGSPAEELSAVGALLHDARHRVPFGEHDRYDALVAELGQADGCSDLPHAVVHPDFVPRNVIRSPEGSLVVFDWTGAGWGPRVASLGCLLWAAAQDKTSVTMAMSGYQESIVLRPEELDRLAGAMRIRPLVLACWTFSTGRDRLSAVAGWWEQQRRGIDAAAEHLRAAVQTERP